MHSNPSSSLSSVVQQVLPPGHKMKRRLAGFAARCAMGSWVVLAAMPVAVVVCALA